MIYPIIYDKNTTDFFNLGQGPLTNTIEATVTEERNGAFYFEAEVLIDDKYELIKENSIVKVDAGHTLKDQRFRIKRITPTDEGTAKIYAEHISYLAQELSLQPDIHLTGSAQVVLGIWKNSIIDKNPFVVDSDVSTVSSTHFDISEVSNAREALGGVKGSILDRWGGEYRFDNYHISLLKKRGKPANTLLAYGRNITDFEQDRNITNTYTSVYPFAKYTDDNQKEHLVTIPGYLVDSEHVDKYPNRRALPVDFSNEFKDKAIPTADKLKKLAESYIRDNEIGIPKVSIKLSFLDLSKTLDYEELAPLEELSLCDEVRVSYEKLGVNTTAKVIRTVWNVLTESYDEIEIGEKRMTLSSTLNDQSQAIKEIKDQSNYSLIAANGKNTIFYGLYGSDGTGQPVATMIGDTWYKPVGEDTEFYIWDGTVWKFIMSTVDNKIIQETIDQLEAESEQIKQDVDKALADSEQAREDAFNSDKLAKEAKELAELANQGVILVDEKSNQALADAEAAREEAFDSKAIADEAKLESSKALQKGNHNEVEISNLGSQLQVTNSKVEGNTTNLLNLKLESDKLSSSVSKTQYDLENLNVGGRNYVSSFGMVDGVIYDESENNVNTHLKTIDFYNLTEKDRFIIFQFWNPLKIKSVNQRARVLFYDTDKKLISRLFAIDVTDDSYGINKIDIPENSYFFRFYIPKIQNVKQKVELGQIPTDWNESFLDLITQNEFSTFEQTYRGFQTNVEGQFAVVKNDTQKVSDELSNTNNKLDDVDKKADNNADKLDNVNTELVTFKSQQTQMANQINSTVEQLGGIVEKKNLIPFWELGGVVWKTGVNYPDTDRIRTDFIEVQEETTYCLSENGVEASFNTFFYDENKMMISEELFNLTNRVKFETLRNTKYVKLVKQQTNQTDNKYQLEKGSQVTAYAPFISNVSKSEVTQLSDQLTQTITKTTVLEGQLSQQQSQVNQLSDKLTVNISDTSANATKISQLELTTSSMSLTLASVERENDRLNTKVVSLEANLNGFQATVSDELNGVKAQQTLMSTQMNTTISKVETIDGKVSKQQTEITQLSNSISSIVSEFEGEGTNVFADPDFTKRNPLISSSAYQTFVDYVANGLKIKCDKTTLGEFIVFPCTEKLTLHTTYEIELTANSDCQIEPGSLSATYSDINLKSGEKRTLKGTNKYVNANANNFYIAVSIMSDITIHSLKIFNGTGGYLKRSEFHQFSDKFLFQVGTNKLMITADTTYIANATIDNAMIQNAAISNAKIQDASISNAKIINVDAAKITTGYLNSNRIQARSITANHLAVDAITVGFNNSSTNINLYGDRIEMSQNGRKTAQLVGKGLSFHDNNLEIGSFAYVKGLLDSSQKGIMMNLSSYGDFLSMGWGIADMHTYPYIMVDKTGKNNAEKHKGIWLGENVYFKGDIMPNGGATHSLRFGTLRFNSYDYPALMHYGGKTGIVFGANVLYLLHNGNVYSVGDIVRGAGFK